MEPNILPAKSEVRICGYEDLIELAERGQKNEFNRTLDVKQLKAALDPEGNNVISIILYGHNWDSAGELRPLHHRVICYAKLLDTDKPAELIFDVADHDLNQLKAYPITVKA